MIATNVQVVFELDGVGSFTFNELINVGVNVEEVEYQDGEDRTLRKRPGRTKVANVILRGASAKPLKALWDSYKTTQNGQIQRHDGRVRVRNSQGQDIVVFELKQCWVASWKATVLAGTGTPQLVEEIEIASETLTRSTPN